MASEAVELKVGSIATVVTNDLRVRSRPEVSEASEKLVPLLRTGQALLVVKGPVAASGYRWYEVAPMNAGIDNRPPFGWVAAADKTGQPWIKPGGFACPKAPTTFNAFMAVERIVWLACYGRKPLSFPARIGAPEATCGVDPGWTVTPEWLGAICVGPAFFVVGPKANSDSFYSIIEPRLDVSGFRPGFAEKDWIPVTVTGAFDHPASKSCRGKLLADYASPMPGPDEVILGCRTQYVISGIKRRT
jgi:hypothetical protein